MGEQRADLSGTFHEKVIVARDIAAVNITNHYTGALPEERYTVPHLLLPMDRVYVKRKVKHDLLDELRANAKGPLVVYVTGHGGVGKSAMALRWLDEISDAFPDGQLYAYLGGGASVAKILNDWLVALGVPQGAVPPTDTERIAKFRTLTANRRIAVLVDDPFSAAQIDQLRPTSPDSVLVITGHASLDRVIGVRGVEHFILDVLDEDDGAELLTELVGRERVLAEPTAAEQLVDLCAGLPIAIRTVGYRLRRKPWERVEDLVRELTPVDTRAERFRVGDERPVIAAFELSYQGLPAETRSLLVALGSNAGAEFGEEFVEFLGATDDQVADLVIAGLAVVVSGRRPPRWRLHEFAYRNAQRLSSENAELRRGTVDWYLKLATAADRTLSGRWRISDVGNDDDRFPTPDAAMAWLAAEQTNLRAAVELACEAGWYVQVWQLCEALWGLYFRRNDFSDWQTTHEYGIEAAVRVGDRAAEARIRCQLGFAYFHQGDFDEALSQFEAARQPAEGSGDDRVLAATVESIGLALLRLGRPDEALGLFEETRAVLERAEPPDRRALANVWHHRSKALGESGRHQEAIDGIRDHVVPAMREIGDEYNRARALTTLGEVLHKSGRDQEATVELREALRVFSAEQVPLQAAAALTVLADVLADATEAEACLVEAEDIYTRLGSGLALRVRERLAALRPGDSQ